MSTRIKHLRLWCRIKCSQLLKVVTFIRHSMFFMDKYICTYVITIDNLERELLESLPFAEQCTEGETELLRLLYESKLKKYQEPNKKQSLVTCSIMGICISEKLANNLDMEVTKAERLYYNCEYHQCFALTEK